MSGYSISPGGELADHSFLSGNGGLLDLHEKEINVLVSFDLIISFCSSCGWRCAGELIDFADDQRLYGRAGMVGFDEF